MTSSSDNAAADIIMPWDNNNNNNNNSNNNMSCTIKDFIYYDINGNIVNGTKTKLNDDDNNNNNNNNNESSSYTCIFNEANCHPSSLPHECCTYDKELIDQQMASSSWTTKYMVLCILIPILYLKTSVNNNKEKEEKKMKKKMMKMKKKKSTDDENQNESEIIESEGDDDDKNNNEDIDDDDDKIPWYITKIKSNKTRTLIIWVWSKGFIAFMMLTVPSSILLLNSYQTNLSVSNRNLMIAAEAFMIPYQTIFNFIEDIILGKDIFCFIIVFIRWFCFLFCFKH